MSSISISSSSSQSLDQNNQNRGQNALQRRALQLKRWQELMESESNSTSKKTSCTRVQFSSATLFLSAVAQNDIEECERLLRSSNDLDVNVTTGDGLTALHQMAIDDNLEMCRWLLKNCADVNCKDNEGWTPLHASASCGHLEIVRLLLSREECDVFAINCDGELARDVCDGDQCLHAIEERMKRDLKKLGLDVEEVVKEDNEEEVIAEELLIEMRRKELKAIELDFKEFLNRNQILTEKVVSDWLERTRDPQSKATVVHVCAAKGYNECLTRIVEAIHETIDLDSFLDCDGFTALHASAFWQQMSTFETLLKFGANFELKTRDSRLVTDLCHENPKIVELMSETKKSRDLEKELNEKTRENNTSETQRKLNAKRQRETRRPTQGVTKEDIEMALKTTKNNETTNDDKREEELEMESSDVMTTAPPVPLSPPPVTTVTTQQTTTGQQPLAEQNGNVLSSAPIHPQRRRPKRRSTGIEDNLNISDLRDNRSYSESSVAPSRDTTDGKDDTTILSTTSPSQTTSRSRSSSRSSVGTTDDSEGETKATTVEKRKSSGRQDVDEDDTKDYKKLYKELLIENEFLIKKIKDFENNRKIEKEFQEFQREKRQLIRRVSELEEELKQKEELLKDNLRLKDENSALIRVISKLSK